MFSIGSSLFLSFFEAVGARVAIDLIARWCTPSSRVGIAGELVSDVTNFIY